MSQFQCDIVTPESKLFSDMVHMIVLPGSDGEMGVLEGHAPTVTTLKTGTVRVEPEDGAKSISFIVGGGYAQIDGEHTTVLADRAADLTEIDERALAVACDEMREQLQDLAEDDPNAAFLKSEIAWNETLIKMQVGQKTA